jgi:hypothetical protein
MVMKRNRIASLAGLLCSICLPSSLLAQSEELEQVIVTGTRISEGGRAVQPFISRRVTADFVWVEVICQSGSLNQTERARELSQTFANLVTKVAATQGLKLSGGDIEDNRIPIETVRYSEVVTRSGNIDRFSMVLSLDTRRGEAFDAIVARATDFTKTFGTVGRSECQIGDEQKIGLRSVQRHREDLLSAIAADAAAIQAKFSGRHVEVSGLEARVIAVPATALELDLYIPYKLSVVSSRAP